MFKIIKKGSGNFWHNFNNGSKEVNLSDWEIVLDSVNQTVSLQMLNGANVPINSVIISDVVVIDETDSSIEETFGGVSALRTRLIELNYTPYIVLNGFVPEAPIDGLTYGRKDAEWVEVSGGGSVGTLQQVTDNGNTTTNDITAGGFLSLGNANIPGINFNDAEDLDTSLGFLGADPSITTPRNWVLPDTSGTIALNSDIPTELSELNEDATHRLVTDTQISTWNAMIGGSIFQSVWNASTNTPSLSSGVGTKGYYYIVSVDGTTNLDGISDWKVGDWAIFDGTVWRKVDNTDSISSFNGRTGAITLLDTDVLPLLLSGLSAASGTYTSSDTILTAFGKIKYLIDNIASTYQAILTDVNFGSLINGFSSKTTPVGADGFLISNSADSNKAYKVSYTNLSATLKSYFDTLYANPALIVKRILNNTVETTPLTGTTSETLIYSAPVIAGGTFSTNDYFNFQLTFRKNGVSETACTYRVKVSNTNDYATATLIASWQSQRYNTILQRLNLYFKSNGTLNSPVQTSALVQTDLTNSSVSLTSISLDPTQDIYFFVSAQLTTSTESVTMNAIKIFN